MIQKRSYLVPGAEANPAIFPIWYKPNGHSQKTLRGDIMSRKSLMIYPAMSNPEDKYYNVTFPDFLAFLQPRLVY